MLLNIEYEDGSLKEGASMCDWYDKNEAEEFSSASLLPTIGDTNLTLQLRLVAAYDRRNQPPPKPSGNLKSLRLN
jgi:hypothetical protein